jgi:hypothetical protein
MDTTFIAAEVLRKLINTKTHYKNPVHDCLEAYLTQRQITLSEDEKEIVRASVTQALERIARGGSAPS